MITGGNIFVPSSNIMAVPQTMKSNPKHKVRELSLSFYTEEFLSQSCWGSSAFVVVQRLLTLALKNRAGRVNFAWLALSGNLYERLSCHVTDAALAFDLS